MRMAYSSAEPSPPCAEPAETWEPPQQPFQRRLPRLWPCEAQHFSPLSICQSSLTTKDKTKNIIHTNSTLFPVLPTLCSAAGAFSHSPSRHRFRFGSCLFYFKCHGHLLYVAAVLVGAIFKSRVTSHLVNVP